MVKRIKIILDMIFQKIIWSPNQINKEIFRSSNPHSNNQWYIKKRPNTEFFVIISIRFWRINLIFLIGLFKTLDGFFKIRKIFSNFRKIFLKYYFKHV